VAAVLQALLNQSWAVLVCWQYTVLLVTEKTDMEGQIVTGDAIQLERL